MEIEQIVFEVRYHFGTLYLDRCGRIVRELTLSEPEWIFKDATPNSGTLISSNNGTTLNFNSAKIDLSIQRSAENTGLSELSISKFVSQVGSTVPRILDKLDIEPEMVSRIGCRTIVSFPMQSEVECESWISSKQLFDVSGFESFEAGGFRNSSSTVVIDGNDASYRISIGTAEHATGYDAGQRRIEVKPRSLPKGQREALLEMYKGQKVNKVSEWAVLLDVDAFRDDPSSVESADFVERSTEKVFQFAAILDRQKNKS